jgi:hypothetical protein
MFYFKGDGCFFKMSYQYEIDILESIAMAACSRLSDGTGTLRVAPFRAPVRLLVSCFQYLVDKKFP